MPLLNGVLPLHDPTQCDCAQGSEARRCVPDVEAFSRGILNAQIAIGVKTKAGFSGGSQIREGDYDKFLGDLCSAAFEFSRKFDGRGRLAGFLAMKLHYEVTNLKRSYYGSTRYSRPTLELTDDEHVLIARSVDFSGPEVLELVQSVELSPRSRRTLEVVVIPLVFGEQSVEDFADRSGKPLPQIHGEIRRLGRELEQKGLLVAA